MIQRFSPRIQLLRSVLALTLIAGVIECKTKTLKSADNSPPLAAMVAPPRPTSLTEAVTSLYRTPENTARDIYRHPLETLTFFGLRPDMSVIEVAPGTGWYSEILAPYLAQQGNYIQAGAQTPNPKLAAWLKAHPEIANSAQSVVFSPPEHTKLGEENSVDMVLTFRNAHNWIMQDQAKSVFAAFFHVLKPGGILGIVDHRADHPKPNSGYVSEKQILKLAAAAGFKLSARSEINANPRDTKDYAEGVWTLPPSLRLGDKDKARYLAIGESDRLTLRFIKPDSKKKTL